MKGLYYDTAMSANRHALASLLELVGPERILFGSDYPFMPEPVIARSVENLTTKSSFDRADLAAIERENALALFPRLCSG